jgi:hypothetical protein
MVTTLLLALSLVQVPLPPLPNAAEKALPTGTRIAIRFLDQLQSGGDSVGTLVRAQTMAPLAAGPCVLVPAFSSLYGTVDHSNGGRIFGGRGSLHLHFDSVQTTGGSWVAIAAELDSLEWAGSDRLTDNGQLSGHGRSFKQVVGTTGGVGVAAAATGIGAIPVIAVTGLNVIRRGAQAQILAAQEGILRLTEPLEVFVPGRCSTTPAVAVAVTTTMPVLPPLRTRTTNKAGDAPGDPINLAIQGTREDLEAAFTRAGWLAADQPTPGHLAQGVGAAIVEASAPRAPVSHQYYFGRSEDGAFERSSSSARARHHVRIWQVDSAGTLWVGAATEDIGLLVNPLKARATHRIDPAIDHERDLLTRELLAGGCASFAGYASLGGVKTATNVMGQSFATDGKLAVLRVQCPEADPS